MDRDRNIAFSLHQGGSCVVLGNLVHNSEEISRPNGLESRWEATERNAYCSCGLLLVDCGVEHCSLALEPSVLFESLSYGCRQACCEAHARN